MGFILKLQYNELMGSLLGLILILKISFSALLITN